MKARTFLFWVHLAIGVSTLIFIFIMSATGVLLTYERQILVWYDTHDYRAAPPSPATTHLPADRVAAAVRAAQPDARVASITFHADPSAPAEVGLGRRTFFVNPYSGQIWGERTQGPRPFFRAVSAWHTGLATGRDGIGHTIAAASNLAVVFMILSGLVLWVPRNWTWSAVRNIVWFRRRLPGKARDFNWHHVLGFWVSIPLLIIVLGALPMSYSWASDLVFRAVGQQPEPRRGSVEAAQNAGNARGLTGSGRGRSGGAVGRGRAGGGGGRGSQIAEGEASGGGPSAQRLDRVTELWARVERQNPGWQTISARLPANDGPVEFTIEHGTSQQPQKRAVLSLDMNTGETVNLVTFGDRSFGARIRTYLRFAHTGEVLAFPSQTVAAIAALAACVMSWTGLALFWRRLFGKRRANAHGSPESKVSTT